MRHPMPKRLLLVFALLSAIALPLVPAASAEADRLDWVARIAEMDQALAEGRTPAVAAAWQEAWVAAHTSRAWDAMIAVGDAALRAGRATGTPELFEPRARRAYSTALIRARRQASREGVLAAAAGFGRLGDRDAERRAQSEAAELAIRAHADEARRGAGAL